VPGLDIAQFWEAFVTATGVTGATAVPEAWAFGPDSNPDLQTRLARLALSGIKRGTTSILADYQGEPLPRPGDHSIVLDGDGSPRCIIRTTGVEVCRFGDVDSAFARAEGEGDLSLTYWRRAHLDAFATQGRRICDDTRVVLQRFTVVWPPPTPPGGDE
jgi:uncharacterized protein YhfF